MECPNSRCAEGVRVYPFFGIRLETELPLAVLEDLSSPLPYGDGPRVRFRKRCFSVPARSKKWVKSYELLYWIPPDRRRLFVRSPWVGDFRLDFPSRTIDWSSSGRENASEFAQLLLSSRLLGLFLPYVRPSLLLHAGIPVVHGKAVCFVGPSGRGKSTLAAGFLQKGFPLLSDEMAVIRKEKDGQLRLPPGLPDLRLWPTAISGLRMQGSQLRPFAPRAAKKRLPLQGYGLKSYQADPVPLGAVYLLSRMPVQGIEIQPLRQPEALFALARNAYNRIIEAPEILRQQFEVTLEVIRRVPVKRLCYPSDFSLLPKVTEAVLRDLRLSGLS